ncbi:MAG: glycosyltransferase [Bacteroidia bacterium]|jgi:GT2 family glycosyltransferase
MASDKRSISVVIPNYNGKHLLEANLPSVIAALQAIQTEHEIIVVDDASSDGSVKFLQKDFPQVKLLVHEYNKGFAPTMNKGIFEARYDLVLALNSDVALSADYFKEQLKYFGKTDTFGVMGRIVDHSGTQLQDAAKLPKVSFKGIKGTYNYIPEALPVPTWLPSFFLSGANALMDRKKLLELNGFDEIYAPFYFEDADLGIRAWRVGWKCYFEPASVCMHELSSTISKLKSQKVKTIIERNRIQFNYLHLSGTQLFLFKRWCWLRSVGRLLKGDITSYKALQLVDKADLERSKLALRQLQQKNNVFNSIGDVERLILKSISAIPYRIF